MKLKDYKPYPLMHCTDEHARPVMYKKGKHQTYAGFLLYPVYLDVRNKEVRIAVDFIVVAPKVYVKNSIPFHTSYPLSEIFIQ